AQRTSDFSCEFDNQQAVDDISTPKEPAKFEFIPGAVPETVPETSSGSQLRTYRLALGATNEYAVAVGGNTIAGTLAAQVLIMNRVNGVYERDLAIHMNIVANNNLIVYAGDQMCGTIPAACTSTTDPYSNTMATTLLTENQTNLDAVIGSANYDIGHVFSTGGGGVASVNVPCRAGQKARGETGLTNPVGDAFAIDYVAHEVGHQWGGLHTFNGSVSNCAGGNRSGSAAYEPGSGVTIMAYAGICGNQNLAAHSIDTFHVKSLEQIIAYSQTGTGNTCAVTTASANTPPSVSVLGGTSFNIPKQTPFALTASGSDADGDTVTYDWQEYDLGAATTEVPNSDATLGAMPIFRPYLPTVSGTHYFPTLDYVRNNSNVPPSTYNGTLLTGELLPSIARTMTFQVVARDNHALAGGVSTATASVVVDGASGPFAVTAPNTAGTWAANSTQTVTWNVANTGAGTTVNAANVKISLSTDGGLTFPITLLASTSNDGAKAITVPNVVTSAARIKVEAVGNIFFDMSDANFTISASSPLAPKRFDFDGDGKADPAVYRGGAWYMLQSQAGFSGVNFGLATDKTVAADYDGDGKTDVAVFRDGVWYVLRSQLGLYVANFGSAGDLPVAGDYTGDGKADLTVFRSGVWYTQNIATNARDDPAVRLGG
ncbi:MAG: reprolysin-like metallopeptidase, partial [Pyrinomonadaceae bacterium]